MSKAEFWIPPSSTIHKTPGRFLCEVCAKRLPPEDREAALFQTAADLWRHLEGTPGRTGCAERNRGTVKAMSPALSAPGLFDENYHGSDLAWKKWIDDHQASEPENWMEWMKTDEGKN